MKRGALGFLFLIACISPLAANIGEPPKVSLTSGTSGSWNLAWSGRDGLTYFSQWSQDLIDWKYLPGIEHDSGTKSQGFTSTTPKYFVRLFYTDIPTNDAELADFDLDGLRNLAELNLGTNPMDADSDHDGIPDGIENASGGNPLSNTDGDALRSIDSDGDGVSDAVERVRGTSPTLWDSDGDGFNDAQDVFPLDPTRHDNSLPATSDTTRATVTLETPANAILVSGP
ncbi:MAG: hypothetical protein ABI600_11705 [Luteolibacter sp.]